MLRDENKVYLGDGAYCQFVGYEFVLTTEDGIQAQNTVYLEHQVLRKLAEFVRSKGFDL